MQQCIRIYYSMFIWSSTCFERHTAHHQELKNCTSSLWFYIRGRFLDQQPPTYVKPEAASAVLELLMMSGVSLETRWASHKHGIINSDTLLHLVGYFCMNYYTTMHGSTNIKLLDIPIRLLIEATRNAKNEAVIFPLEFYASTILFTKLLWMLPSIIVSL